MSDERIIAGLGTRAEHVAVSPRFDPRATKLAPDEAAVLAAIGKARQVGELISHLTLDENRTIATLLGLLARGVIVKARVQAKPKARTVSAALLEEVALGKTLKLQILELEALLETPDPFALLGLPKGADAAAAKEAYFKLARRLHPDRHFRKNLGSFRARLDNVFKALAGAHQTLTDPAKREAYLAAHPQPPSSAPPAVEAAPRRAPMKRMSWSQKDFPLAPADPGPKREK